jgi:hypothetical protein
MGRTFYLVSFILVYSSIFAYGQADTNSCVLKSTTATLNGLHITFDSQSGNITRLSYPDIGGILDSNNENAGIVRISYVAENGQMVEWSPQSAEKVEITQTKDQVKIQWHNFGKGKTDINEGQIGATVTFKLSPESNSVIMQCNIDNQSKKILKQVIFPDFRGITAFGGKNETQLTTSLLTSKPFVQLVPDTPVEYTSGGLVPADSSMGLRWLEIGSLKGGLSIFPKKWGWDSRAKLRQSLSSATGKLELGFINDVEILPGQSWQDCEYILTPHRSGWANGLAPFRKWVTQNVNVRYPLAKHIKEGLGFRSVWMAMNNPADPQDAIWRFSDLPDLARECSDYGLTEMVLWAWCPSFELPIPKPFAELGTEQEMIAAQKKCKSMGVNISYFISVILAVKKTAHKYGLEVIPSPQNNWTYHPELVPMFGAPYAQAMQGVPVPLTNKFWQNEVVESCAEMIRKGQTSITWDLYWAMPDKSIHFLTKKIRDMARKADPNSTFSGEEHFNLELDCEYLDYTWNWSPYALANLDLRPVISILRPYMRFNWNINKSPEITKYCFVNNLFMNVWPSKPDMPNGSDYIANNPELSAALKQCNTLRKQFLEYFANGMFIADCILTNACQDAHVSAYVLPESMLIVVLNKTGTRNIPLQGDLSPYLAANKGYIVKKFKGEGKMIDSVKLEKSDITLQTGTLESSEIVLYEVSVNH